MRYVGYSGLNVVNLIKPSPLQLKGFAAGMMIAVSLVELIGPAVLVVGMCLRAF